MSVYGETRKLIVAPVGAAVAGLIMQGISTLNKLARAIEHRRVVSQMLQFDDYLLRDVGLTRADLCDAASEPIWSDPSHVLVSRAVERRAANRLRGRVRDEV
ncbi:DUF1127 domain-containing protein [Aquabacter sp. P-9]|uniref:DUF1127 domain-containing protein n=1 Tax=Aquabacter sediminis TaxID=3029197 RepID=UPI00237E6906|nr:DUF1127 domain-containing protein [Aquabacter sp. P-9]MDE1566828.1 DUF1127 domain-containing protein [Aquabacter sp. P-9]